MVDWTAAVVVMLVGIISVFMVLGLLSIAVTVTGFWSTGPPHFRRTRLKTPKYRLRQRAR